MGYTGAMPADPDQSGLEGQPASPAGNQSGLAGRPANPSGNQSGLTGQPAYPGGNQSGLEGTDAVGDRSGLEGEPAYPGGNQFGLEGGAPGSGRRQAYDVDPGHQAEGDYGGEQEYPDAADLPGTGQGGRFSKAELGDRGITTDERQDMGTL